MSAQTALQGRFLGGRPPYGYRLVDAGEHPNPAKARLGVRLHALEPDPATAPVVERIFTMFLDGYGYLAIAERLPQQQIPPPSGHDRVRNPHRLGVAWSKSAVRAILQNPRYTGYQVWNKQRRDEVLLDIDDVAAGHISRMRWNPPDEWVYSADATHPALVSREVFDQVQARIAARSRTSPRAAATSRRPYVLRGRLACGLCQRRLQGQWVRGEAYYRCRYPSEYATSVGLAIRSTSTCARPTCSPSWTRGFRGWSARPTSRRPAAGWPPPPSPPARPIRTCEPPNRSWPTASASWSATVRRWRLAATLR
jgi:site-specific DNA recombinase